jgi:hypothetical protein
MRIRPRQLRSILLAVLVLAIIAACDTSSLTLGTPSTQSGSGGSGGVAANPGGGLPENASKPPPPPNTFQGCPATGDGGDPQLNLRKNRTDSASWNPVSIAAILGVGWPRGIEQRPRSTWPAADAAQVARYDGIPVQIEGWLAGAKQQGPESCNCHSANDVDNHLWVVDSPSKDRTQSVVSEVTPRVRALHPGWAFSRISALVDGKTKVRISGWLLMDQEHPDQVGKTRGTIWEIHPIIAFDYQRGGNWVSLDTGRASGSTTTGGSQAVPTEDPNLPPPISDPFQDNGVPTAKPLPTRGQSGGVANSSGSVQIDDIFYNGIKGSSEPDEYVEIANTGSQPVNMDGWVLRDSYGEQEFTWHNFTFDGLHKIRVYTNESHPESGGFSFGSSSAIWANKGDAAELADASGTIVSTFAYGNKK